MSHSPVKLSVVMAVYNGSATLRPTMDSVLSQSFRDFELVVVDDGSSDATPAILGEYAARDQRVRVITQSNSGLTRALIRGCSEARGSVIARQDCGDRSLPNRFERQLESIERGHALVSCITRFVSQEGDLLYERDGDGIEIRETLLTGTKTTIHGITSHPSAMFTSAAYHAAGGYRPQFRTGQDLDLWIRIARVGTIDVVPAVLMEVTVDPDGISGRQRMDQLHVTELAIAIRDGGDETALLQEVAHLKSRPRSPRSRADALYFIGKCLLAQRNSRGRGYLQRAIKANPLHVRAWVSLLLSLPKRR